MGQMVDVKQGVKARFDNLSSTYDQIYFLKDISLRLAELADLKEGDHVLDVATGTGAVAIPAARTVGLDGKVVGIDLSPEMVVLAGRKAADAGLRQLEVREGDAEHLDFEDNSFDRVLCSLGLFFMPDMVGALREWHRVLKPGGSVGFASFGQGLYRPLYTVWENRLRVHGIAPAPTPIRRLETIDICLKLLLEAGFDRVESKIEQLGYLIQDPKMRWNDIVTGLEGEPLRKLDEPTRKQIEQEHLAELAEIIIDQGVFVEVPAIFSFGFKPV